MKQNSQVKRIFEPQETAKLEDALRKDSIVLDVLTKLVDDTCKELLRPSGLSDFSKGSWALEKAYREGGAYHLQQLLKIFKEK